jgi:hypothetical protein
MLTQTRIRRTGFLALAVTFSAGIHAALVPEHLKKMSSLGYAFIVAAVVGGVLAWGIKPRRVWPRHHRDLALAHHRQVWPLRSGVQ